MTGHEIRKTFLDFFAQRDHRVVRSSPLLPQADPTLLFTNAGMNQFKDVFLGLEQRDSPRAASAQKCLRAGGKHNDLENVGRTLRHHTFFEMLGNFSFGDYFKRDAIAYAWELLTAVWKLPKDKLYITVFREDDEAFSLWQKEVGIPAERIARLGEEENYWAMGDTGPCGPCSEIQYDFGPAASELGHKECRFPCPSDCGRYVELWNLVFMQFNRDASGQLTPLPKPSIDTGLGLERIAAVLQGKLSNYDTDLFHPLIARAAEMANTRYGSDPRTDTALRIIADHSRAAAFLVADGVLPSNEGRGYVLRKILRRAIDHGRRLGLDKPFLFEMVGHVADLMREPYPEVLEAIQRIATVVKAEEEKYARLVVPALERFYLHIGGRGRFGSRFGSRWGTRDRGRFDEPRYPRLVINGQHLFFAYDTLGLRPDFIRDLAQEQGWEVAADADKEFEAELKKQRERAKASWIGVGKEVKPPTWNWVR
ncbi:MAG: alanine--tRNA ligase [Terriglobia bacterium]